MKFLIVVFLAIFARQSSAWTLTEAWAHVMEEMGPALHAMEEQWRYFFLQDDESCRYIYETNPYWTNVWNTLNNDPVYRNLTNDLHAAGIQWDQFIDQNVKPAFGYFLGETHTCSGYAGGLYFMQAQVMSSFEGRRVYVQTAINAARAASPEYEAIHQRVAANQQAGTNVRCSAAMRSLEGQMLRYYFELNFFLEKFAMLLSLYVPESC